MAMPKTDTGVFARIFSRQDKEITSQKKQGQQDSDPNSL